MSESRKILEGFRFGPFDFDTLTKKLYRDSKPCTLRPQCVTLLVQLLESAPRPVGKDTIKDILWPKGSNVDDKDNLLTTCVGELRRALGDFGHYVESVKAVGYLFAFEFIQRLPEASARPIDVGTPDDTATVSTVPPRWETDTRLFEIESHRIPYIPLVDMHGNPVKRMQIELARNLTLFPLDSRVEQIIVKEPPYNDLSCRLVKFRVEEDVPRLEITFARTWYREYLKSAHILGHPFPMDHDRTYRDEFIRMLPDRDFTEFPLSSITGVGVFVITADKPPHILISRHSPHSHVYANRWTFSASGTMKWGAFPDPFSELARKTFTEIRHQVNLDQLRLYNLGVDAEKLYFQLCFYENTSAHTAEMQDLAAAATASGTEAPTQLKFLPLSLDSTVPLLRSDLWEPAAAAGLILLLINRFGRPAVEDAIRSSRSRWKHDMEKHWTERACRGEGRGLLADMSPRYPHEELENGSRRYVSAVMQFIGEEIRGKDVVEIGCGATGRLTRELATHGRRVTCLDHCPAMIVRNKAVTHAEGLSNIEYIEDFAQEYSPGGRVHDVSVCSLVLIHNVTEADFYALVRAIVACSRVAFVFEDTSHRGTSRYTKLRSPEEIRDAFEAQGMKQEDGRAYDLFTDRIAFLKFRRGIIG